MPLIYITGSSGAGKTTIRNELITQGFEAHDTDEDGISAWYDNATHTQVTYPDKINRPSDWHERHSFLMSDKRIKALAERAKTHTVFLCGVPSNDTDFVDYFDTIICLVIDEATTKARLATRTTNNFGKSPDELALILYWRSRLIERYQSLNAIMIDANQPIETVVAQVLANARIVV